MASRDQRRQRRGRGPPRLLCLVVFCRRRRRGGLIFFCRPRAGEKRPSRRDISSSSSSSSSSETTKTTKTKATLADRQPVSVGKEKPTSVVRISERSAREILDPRPKKDRITPTCVFLHGILGSRRNLLSRNGWRKRCRVGNFYW